MKRDKDYLKELLFEYEKYEAGFIAISEAEGMTDEGHKEYYHVQLLCDEGHMIKVDEQFYRLTAKGHDFIESIRNKEKAAEISSSYINTK